MNQQKLYTCQNIEHEGEDIQGFCLNFRCKASKSQFCMQCGLDPMIHVDCKKDLKGFGQIQSFITKFNENLVELNTQLKKSFVQVKRKYEECSKEIEDIQQQVNKISEYIIKQDYQYIKENLSLIKECYQFLNQQEEIVMQNEICTKLYIFNITYYQQIMQKE